MKTLRVLIADDEPAVREGLKTIVDWEMLGFSVCAEAGNGKECLDKILSLEPDLVLLDIRMPMMQGLEIAEEAVRQGFHGRIVIVSGYSDFQYAKTAIGFGVNNYLLKPIDEKELEETIKKVKKELDQEQQRSARVNRYMEKAKSALLIDLIRGKKALDSERDDFNADSYSVIAVDTDEYDEQNPYESLYRFFSLSGDDRKALETVRMDGYIIYLLKGAGIIKKISHLSRDVAQRTQTLRRQGLFAAQGRTVVSASDIYLSYTDALNLMERRFFFPREICFATGPKLISHATQSDIIGDIDTRCYTERLLSYIETCNQERAYEIVDGLCDRLCEANAGPEDIKNYLSSVLIQVKQAILEKNQQLNAFFESDVEIIVAFDSADRLYKVVDYIKAKMDGIMNVLGYYSRDRLIDKMIYYIDQNYGQNLKLETLSQLFGYNSAYLGKLFKSNVGECFNSYLCRVRIANAKRLLCEGNLKVYEISKQIGYVHIEYFYKVFKKYVGKNPSEYRREALGSRR